MANKKINVLFASFEATPFIKTGGLGDVAGSLPSALQYPACEVRVILPKLRQIPQEYHDQMQFLTSFGVPLGWRMQHCGVFTLKLGDWVKTCVSFAWSVRPDTYSSAFFSFFGSFFVQKGANRPIR